MFQIWVFFPLQSKTSVKEAAYAQDRCHCDDASMGVLPDNNVCPASVFGMSVTCQITRECMCWVPDCLLACNNLVALLL